MTQEALALESGLSRNLLVDVELGKSGLLAYKKLKKAVEAGKTEMAAYLESKGAAD